MYWATSLVCLGVSRGGLRTPSLPRKASGMRPVLTWKSTAAEPTPIRPGAALVPCAYVPWQVAQSCAKIRCPALTRAWAVVTGGEAEAEVPAPVTEA